MKVGGRARLLPQPHESAVPWDYFLVEAGRGGARATGWVHGAVCVLAADHGGVAVEEADDSHLSALLGTLPPSPDRWLDTMLSSFRLSVHTLGAMGVEPAAVGTPIEPIPAHTLVHDASVQFRRNYGAQRLSELFVQLEATPLAALLVCEASLYLLLLMEGEPAEVPELAPAGGRLSHWITPGE